MTSIENVPTLAEHSLGSLCDYTRLSAGLDTIVQEHGTANQAFAELGRQGLLDTLVLTSPEASELLDTTRQEVFGGVGAVILCDTGAEGLDDQVAQLLSITLGCVYGQPTKTDRRLEQIAWPVKYDADATMNRTFSQTQEEAEFHTDTQYFPDPESAFGLFCVRADQPGKGTNELVSIHSIIAALREEAGNEVLDALSQPFPFRVPSVFTATGRDSDIEINWAPILSGDRTSIRFRRDTIDNALSSEGITIAPESQMALDCLSRVLQSIPPITRHLAPGEALIVNNHTMLHARTAFNDPKRLLYRVRTRSMGEQK